MSIVRLTWATVTAFYLATLCLCLALVLPGLATDLEAATAARSHELATELSLEFANLPGEAGAPTAAWWSGVQGRAEREGWVRLEIQPTPKGLTAVNQPAHGMAAWWAHGWAKAGAKVMLRNAQGSQGELWLTASVADATARLNRTAWMIMGLFAVMGALLLAALRKLERWAREPLDGFYEQIMGLSDRHFVEMKQPKVSEWVELSKSLNVMVARVRHMLNERDEVVGSLTQKLDRDALTQTASRDLFMMGLKGQLRDNEAGGGVAIVRVNDLEGLNRRLGRNRTDELLVAVATIVRARLMLASDKEQPILARLNGADFGLLLGGCDVQTWRQRLEGVADGLQQLVADGLTDSDVTAWIGGSTFAKGESMGDVLVRVDTMVMSAEADQTPVAVTEPSERKHVIALAQWRTMLEAALDTGHFDLACFPVTNADGELLHRDGMLRMLDGAGHVFSAGEFIAPAIRCGRIVDLDLKALELALAELAAQPGGLTVNVAPQSVVRPIFQRRLTALLQNNAEVASRLSIELREGGSTADSTRLISTLHRVVKPYGCRLGIDHVGVNLSALPLLSAPGVAYVKLAERLVRGVALDERLQGLVTVLVQWGQRLNVQVVANGVSSGRDAATLAQLGVHGFTGPGVQPGQSLRGELPAVAKEAQLA